MVRKNVINKFSIIFMFLVVITLSSVLAVKYTTYTPSTETVCENNLCVKTLYSNAIFAQNSQGMWVDASDVLLITVDDDALIFTYDGIKGQKTLTFEVGVVYDGKYNSMKKLQQDYPQVEFNFPIEHYSDRKKYSINLTNIPVELQNKLEYVVLDYKNHGGFQLSKLKEKKNKFVVEDIFALTFNDLNEGGFNFTINEQDKKVYIGNFSDKYVSDSLYLDPTIILDDAVSENLDDAYTYVYQPDDNFNDIWLFINTNIGGRKNNVLIKFNLSSIPPNSLITDAELWLYGSENFDTVDETSNVTFYLVNNTYIWSETTLTWNNQPSVNNLLIPSNTLHFNWNSNTQWFNWDVTNITDFAYNNDYSNLSFFSTGGSSDATEIDDELSFRSELYGAPYMPYLEITYEIATDIIVNYPLNGTLIYVENLTANVTVTNFYNETVVVDTYLKSPTNSTFDLICTNTTIGDTTDGEDILCDFSLQNQGNYSWYSKTNETNSSIYVFNYLGQPPTITLQTNDLYRTFDNTPTFEFTPYDDNPLDLMDCTLYINDTVIGVLVDISSGTPSSLTPLTNLSRDVHLWYVNCTDDFLNTKSEVRTITILKEPILNNVEIVNSDYYLNIFDSGTGTGQIVNLLENITINSLDSIISARFDLTGVTVPANNVTGASLNTVENASSCVGGGCAANLQGLKSWVDNSTHQYREAFGLDVNTTNATYDYVLTLPNNNINSINLRYSAFALNALSYNYDATYGWNMNTYIYNRTSDTWDEINIYKKTGETWILCHIVKETINLSNDYKNDNQEIILRINWDWLDTHPEYADVGYGLSCDILFPASRMPTGIVLVNFNYTFDYEFSLTDVSVEVGGVEVEIENGGSGIVNLFNDTLTVEIKDELDNCLGAGGTCNVTFNRDLLGDFSVDNIEIYYKTTAPEIYTSADDIYCGADGKYIETYNYSWQVNSVDVPGETTNVLDNSNFVRTNNVTCFVYGKTNPETETLNDTVTISNSPPTINQLYVTPAYPNSDEDLICNFNVTDADSDDVNVDLTWYKDNISVHTYNTTFINVTQGVLLQTTAGNGSVTEAKQNYTQWKCGIFTTDNINITIQNSTVVGIYPLENLTLISPLNNTISNQKLSVNASVIDDHEGIVCDLYSDSVVIANATPNSRQDFTITNNSYPAVDGIYDWYLSCTANGNPIPLLSEERVFKYDTSPPVISNLAMFESIYYPQIGDLVDFNATVTDGTYIDTCKLALNDTNGIYQNKSTIIVHTDYTADIIFDYEITADSTANNSNVGWKVWCNDSLGYNVESPIQTFIVKDVLLPLIIVDNPGNGFSSDNRTIVAPQIQNLTLNLTFFDYNLFQGLVNITCDDAGQIYYWEELDFNITTYVHQDEVDLTGLGLQKCNVFISSSDDHTAKTINKYNETKKGTGYDYKTEYGTTISIDTKQNANDIESLESYKLADRHIFKFNFKDKGLLRDFKVEADKDIFLRDNMVGSKYEGQMVVWDYEANGGNWLDFETTDVLTKTIVEEQNKNYINVYVYPDIPVNEFQFKNENSEPNWNDEDDVLQFYKNIESKVDNFGYLEDKYGMQEYMFNSLGGLNVNNATYAFYLGGAVNITGFNLYDNSTFSNYSLTVTVLNSFPADNQTFVDLPNNTWIANLSNGTYEFAFTDPYGRFFPKTYDINISGPAQNRSYDTYQSIIRIQLRNVATGVLLDNLNLTVTNTNTSQEDFNATVDSTIGTFYLDKGIYTFLGQREDYDDYVENFTVNYLDDRTIIFDMSFLATFNLLDEKTFGPFNVSGADLVEFLLFCEDSTFTTIINSSVAVLPITCDYLKFKFVLTYGTTNYYRTFILDPDDAFDVDVYLIDKLTTQDVFNSFIIDDLLGEYENPRIFIKKIINEETLQITADYIDIENKIGAYLIENNEYIIEVHSDNQPIRIMGFYSAAFSGDKVLRLYDISLETSPASFSSSVSYSAGVQVIDSTKHIVAYYNDAENVTTGVTFNVYQDNYQGTLIYTSSNITSPNIEFDWDLNGTGYENDTLVVQMIIVHQDGVFNYVKIVQDIQTITLDILNFVSPGFLNWFFLILLGVLAIFATIKTANIVSMALIGFASLFVMFGWFGLSSGILALSAFISLLSILKEGEKGSS